MKLQNLKFGTQIIVLVSIVNFILISALVSIIIFVSASNQTNAALQKVDEITSRYASDIGQELNNSLFTARAMKEVVEPVTLQKSLTRNELNIYLKEIVNENESFLGTYTLWEPNAYDNRDYLFRNTLGHDSTGRYIPYYAKDLEGNITLSPLELYETEGDGDYYQLPKKLKKEILTNPFEYKVNGVMTWLTSFVVPVLRNDKFMGIVGVDMSLSKISEIVSQIKPGGGGYATLIANDGNYVAHPNAKMLGKSYFNEEIINNISIGKAYQYETTSEYIKGKVYRSLYPITVGETASPWALEIVYPISEITGSIITGALLSFLGLIIIIAALSLIIALIAKKQTKPLIMAAEYADILSKGDLTHEIDQNLYTRKDEIGQLFLSMKNMVSNLDTIIKTIKEKSGNVSGSSTEVNGAAQSISEASNSSAASIEEISASIEEITAGIEQNADNSRISVDVSTANVEQIKQGGDAVSKMITAMTEISDKIMIIDDIARQTSMLALNAAIEAARAGESGKGFAVVASEVKKLAENSQKAAVDIVEKVQSGSLISQKTGELLTAIVPEIEKASDLVQAINTASIQQAAGVEQINSGMMALSSSSQENAAAAEELASTSSALSDQATEMQESTNTFKTK